MRLIIGVLLCLCVCGVLSRSTRTSRSHNNKDKCNNVKPFFESLNITVHENQRNEPYTSTCGGQCCNRKTEEHLREQARTDFHSLIHHHSRILQGHLARTAETLRGTVTTLARQSENKTLILFEQVYRSMSLLSRPSIKSLYQSIIDYVSPINTTDNMQQSTRTILQERLTKFFTQLFPIAYHYAVNPNKQDFTDKFKNCLYETIDKIQPFGEIPKQISYSVSKSLEAMRVLVQALNLGVTVLDEIDSGLFRGKYSRQGACYNGLLKMTYCPKCSGHSSVSPCKGLCKNIVRGCLAEPASELDLAWSGYVETVERLVVAIVGKTDYGLNAEKAIRELDSQISAAVMHAMKNGPSLEEKVRKACGRSELKPGKSLSEFEAGSSDNTESSGLMRSSNVEDRTSVLHTGTQTHRSLPDHLQTQLGNFVASIVGSRTFYGTLADSICADYPENECWNGEHIGEYTKAVVDSSLNAQKYNPEFDGINTTIDASNYGNSNTTVLINQLRQINQVIQSQLAYAPDVNVLLSDEAWDEEEGSADEVEGSGSPGPTDIDVEPPEHSGAGPNDDGREKEDKKENKDNKPREEISTKQPESSSASMACKSIALLAFTLLIYFIN